ncbi:hypothetical protein [Evansella halocellulosilytica]|uniref:hypothetical protein n=1 Tax=Evansella halocellulosilytica TaxID=2011013 RepID=UPI000BB74C38|nr:hypothetical protein [Evansella halocellulosilytica]
MAVRQMHEFFILFLKVAVTSKMNIVFILGFPLVYMLFISASWLHNNPSQEEFMSVLMIFLSIQVFIMSMQTIANLILHRESGFFKMFKFIAGAKWPIILGQMLANLLFLVINASILTFVTSLLFGQFHVSILFIPVLFVMITLIPATFALMWLLMLKIKQESISAIISISIFFVIFLTFNNFVPDQYAIPFTIVNPAFYSYQSGLFLLELFSYPQNEATIPAYTLFAIGILYVAAGVLFIQRTRIVSTVLRT